MGKSDEGGGEEGKGSDSNCIVSRMDLAVCFSDASASYTSASGTESDRWESENGCEKGQTKLCKKNP